MFNTMLTKSEYKVVTYEVPKEDLNIPDMHSMSHKQIFYILDMWLKMRAPFIKTELRSFKFTSTGIEFTVHYSET